MGAAAAKCIKSTAVGSHLLRTKTRTMYYIKSEDEISIMREAGRTVSVDLAVRQGLDNRRRAW